MISKISLPREGAGSNPSPALHTIQLIPISHAEARNLIVPNHYLHSLPGGTKLSLGIFLNTRLLGALTLGVGPYLGYKIINGACPDDVVTLTRLWLSDELPPQL
jgi:hypothetical protein